jgi:hypothetical protein
MYRMNTIITVNIATGSTMTLVTAVVIFAICCTVRSTEAWSIVRQQQGRSIESIQLVDSLQRRNFVSSIIGTTATTLGITTSLIIAVPSKVQAAAPTSQKVTDAINELKESRDKLKDIPDLLEAKEWDKVRSILKVPPVNKLWNLGDVRFQGAAIGFRGLLLVLAIKWKSQMSSLEFTNTSLVFVYSRILQMNIVVFICFIPYA